MKRIQLGNDITIKWNITKNEDVSLEDTQVVLVDALKKNALFKYNIEDNVITGKFYGKDLRTLGIYSLMLVNNAGEKNMSTLIHPNVFNLVKKLDNKISCGEDDDNIVTETLEITSDITTGWATDLSEYFTKDEVKELIPTKLSLLENDSDFATSEALQAYQEKLTDKLLEAINSGITADKIKELEESGFSGDYHDLANKPDIDSINEKLELLEAIDHSKFLTEHLSLADYALKSELFNKDYNELHNKPNIPSLEGYATESWVEGQNYLTLHLDISGKQDVISDLETIREGAALGKTALLSVPDTYALKADLNGLATEEYVNGIIGNVESLLTNI